MTKISQCEDCGAKLIGYSLSSRTCNACEAKRWNKAGAQRTEQDIAASRKFSSRNLGQSPECVPDRQA